ncbi:cytochrome P450 [Punctularia strigosozonata HHB-11173 SS5]|uniref:cytochrome P450 n=1 Tax=Punctularia strigosozonata (strain HHB-11173) TaxID=741275 RepID=UPI00044185B0|nr:cytochrome P450 [Punctularia strigosozonata HHB-11173 SS5]EIN05790.1 cytochrome P450 [Punctularia strigosozonata HHB-11173 SS5]
MGWDWLIAFLPYGERWKAQRRAISTFMNRNLAKQYRPVQLDEARNLLGRLLVSPELFYDHARHIVGATIMRITYGIKVAHENDKYIKQAELAVSQLSYAGHPTRFYANVFHSLTHVPAWFPGAQFKRDAAIWKIDTTKFCNMPIDAVKANMVSGNAHLSIASALLESPNGHGSRADTQAFAGEVAGAVYAGASWTTALLTVSTVQSFFLAMAMYPEAQHRAQKELDAVVGKSRLPGEHDIYGMYLFDDLDKLPYIAAVCKELLRWIPVAPLGVYHASVNDDVYKGYYIPKGTLVVGNTWSILHDPTVYPDPDAFNPDRFLVDGRLNPSIRDPGCAAFGFGRRICPGRDFLADSLAIIVASVLAMYNIDPPQDE